MLEALDLKVQAVRDAITLEHPYFHPLAPLKAEVDRIEAEIDAAGRGDKVALKAALLTPKAKFDVARKQLVDAIKAREKQVTRAVKELVKLQQERDASEAAIARLAEAEVMHLREAAYNLTQICTDHKHANRYFKLVTKEELAKNEFNLNLPRYIQTYEPQIEINLGDALHSFEAARVATSESISRIRQALNGIGQEE
jgi:type I restriction enzyme M protein